MESLYRHKKVPIIMHKKSEQATHGAEFTVRRLRTKPFRYGELQGFNKQKIADKFGKDKVHNWRRSYDIPPPNGESLEMCAERAVAYFKDQIDGRLQNLKEEVAV